MLADDAVYDSKVHAVKHTRKEIFIFDSGVDGIFGVTARFGLVMGNPVFVNNFSVGYDGVLGDNTIWISFSV